MREYYVEAPFRFSFYGFEWVKPLPGAGMYALFGVLILLGAGVVTGVFARACAALYGALFAYVFLLDKAHYLNHHYLLILLCGLLAISPCEGLLSLRPRGPARVPFFYRAAFLAQLMIVYGYSGLAKLQGDWLLRGQPLRIWFSESPIGPVLGDGAALTALAFFSSWAGFLIVVSAPVAMNVPRVRPFAFAGLIAFHVATGWLLPLGIFPFMAVAALTLFFPPDWPRKLLPFRETASGPVQVSKPVTALVAVHLAVQLLLPLRPYLAPGPVMWNEDGFRFAWHLRLFAKRGSLKFFVEDLATGTRTRAEPMDELSMKQATRLLVHPELLLEYGHHLAERERSRGRDVAVFADAWMSLNGRPLQRYVIPTLDLSRVPRSAPSASFLAPLEE